MRSFPFPAVCVVVSAAIIGGAGLLILHDIADVAWLVQRRQSVTVGMHESEVIQRWGPPGGNDPSPWMKPTPHYRTQVWRVRGPRVMGLRGLTFRIYRVRFDDSNVAQCILVENS